MAVLHQLDMRTTQTTETTPLSGKRVGLHSDPKSSHVTKTCEVCVSSLMIDEIKRIIKDSEIMKYVF